MSRSSSLQSSSKPTLRRRFLLSGSAVILLLAAAAALRVFFFPPPIKIGDFPVPDVNGWKRDIRRGDAVESAFYSKNRLHIDFQWIKKTNGDLPKTAQDLADADKQSLQEARTRLAARGGGVEETVNELTTLHGIPALLTEKNYKGRFANQEKALIFVHGGKFYSLRAFAFLGGQPALTEDQKLDRDAAWKILTDALKP